MPCPPGRARFLASAGAFAPDLVAEGFGLLLFIKRGDLSTMIERPKSSQTLWISSIARATALWFTLRCLFQFSLTYLPGRFGNSSVLPSGTHWQRLRCQSNGMESATMAKIGRAHV